MRVLIGALAAMVVVAPAALAQPRPSAAQRAVESGLLPAVVFDGRAETFTLEERMARWKVPGVSVAVLDDGEFVWVKGYGVVEAGKPDRVGTTTPFQAASISKPVAAAAAMLLVQDGKVALDADVNAVLRGWKLPDSPFTHGAPVTLRHLLTHTGGTTVHGFPGYAQGAAVPTLVQILNGAAPANTRAVTVDQKPGQAWRYSGGGYQIVQQMIEDLSGRPFAEVVGTRVLGPAGMADSGYGAPAAGRFARGHDIAGKPIPGGWHVYPEAAAAGLWTTPRDLGRFGLALTAAWKGEPGAIMNAETARAMLTGGMGDYGLGPGVEGEGPALRISHGGSNEGYRAFWVTWPNTGDGVVVMTNAEAGDRLMMEVVRAVAVAQGWPALTPRQEKSFALGEAELAHRTGNWAVDVEGQHIEFRLVRRGTGLDFETFRGTFAFTPVSATEMVTADTGAKATFATAADGSTVLKVFGLELKKK